MRYAADNIAAVHGERTAADVHAAAFRVVAVEYLAARAAGDDAALDDLRAAVVQHPRLHAVDLEFMLRRGVAVHEGQVAGGRTILVCMEDNDAAAAGHFQHMTVQVEGDLAEDGQGAADVDILRQPDNFGAAAQSGEQSVLTDHGDVQPAHQGGVLRHSRGIVPRRAVGLEPAVEFIASGHGGGSGLGGRAAAGHDLGGVVLAVDLIGHGDESVGIAAGTAVVIVGDLAIDGRAAHAVSQRDHAAPQRYIRVNIGVCTDDRITVVQVDVLLIRGSSRIDRAVEGMRGPAVAEEYAAALSVGGYAVFDLAALHDKRRAGVNAAALSFGGYAAVDHAAVHDEFAVYCTTVVVCFHAAAGVRNAADDSGIVIHLKCAAASHMHTTT